MNWKSGINKDFHKKVRKICNIKESDNYKSGINKDFHKKVRKICNIKESDNYKYHLRFRIYLEIW
jgi:hypothetical protein